MNLFDNIDRTFEGPAYWSEANFAYLNRSARMEVRRIREVLEAWFSRFPPSGKSDLRGRFRSPDDSQHHSAFFELFLHELLLCLECKVHIHPRTSGGSSRRPEFLVESGHGRRSYMEAVLATNESAEEIAARARMNAVYDALERLESPDFFVGLELSGAPATPPPARHMRSFLKQRLAGLDPDQIGQLLESGRSDAVPSWRYEHDGWTIDFFPMPKSPELRSEAGIRPLGIFCYPIREVDHTSPLRGAILAKAGRYGKPDLPYVIAVNTPGMRVDDINVMEALFGSEEHTVWIPKSGIGKPRTTTSRIPDGVWLGRSGPRYTRVSAILLATWVSPWNVPRAQVRLWHNPWAMKPYDSELTRLAQAVPIPQADKFELKEGESLSTIFGLRREWPEG